MIPRPAPLAAVLLGMALLTAPATAQTLSPYAGIDIMFAGRGSSTLVATTGRDGRFSARVRLEPGSDYEVSTACRARTACPSHQLIALTVNGRTVRPVNDTPQRTGGERNGIGIYIIGAVVLGLREPTTVVIAGQVAEAPVADSRGPARAAPRATPGATAIPRN